MTPKEKANKLIDSFYQKLPLEKYVSTSDGDLSWEYISWDRSKECALIAVDEIIDSEPQYEWSNDYWKNPNDFWEEVKQEIEKL